VAVVVLVLLISGIGLGFVLYRSNAKPPIDSIAVLPFVNASGDANVEYLSDGISETLINSLTQLQNLRVVARTTAFRYKGKETDPQTIGRELNVRAVLMGRIRQSGDTLNVQVDLVDATTGAQLWGQEYERRIVDALAVKQTISREITDKLRLKISGEEQKQLDGQDSKNGEAFQLYLNGRYHWNKRTREGMLKSIDYFNQAIEKDPRYALAHAGLADSWFTMGWYRYAVPQEAYAKAKVSAQRALEIDQKLAEAHTIMGMLKGNETDWAAAEKEFKLAIELNPNYPTAHHRYSLFLPILGRLDEAVLEARKAQQLDPLSLIINENVGDILCLARRYDEAEAQLLKTLELDPDFNVASATLAKVYELKGFQEKALDINLKGAPPELVTRLKKIFATEGPIGLTKDRLKDLTAASKHEYVSPSTFFLLYVRLNDKDKAFEWLEKALEQRAIQFTYLVADPRYDNIRTDPRYAAILARYGLKPIN
jgi:TolB-like protein/tetratricopeptide (TPR) repeat protein